MQTGMKALALGAMALTVSGCATIVRGTTEDVQFNSNPSGAVVTTDLGPSCTTPCALKFDRDATFTAAVKLDGQEREVFVDTEVADGGAAAAAGNVLAGGVIGIGIDAASGATLNHVPNPVEVDFTQEPEATTTATN